MGVISKLEREFGDSMAENSIEAELFVISGKKDHESLYDYPDLMLSIRLNLAKMRQHKVVLAAADKSKEMIEEKSAMLGWRVLKFSALSAVAAAIPIRGVSTVADAGILVEEVQHYKEQLELNDLSQWDVAKKLNIPWEVIKNILIDFVHNKIDIVIKESSLKEFVLKQLQKFVPIDATEQGDSFIPSISTVVGSGIAFLTTRSTLNACLIELKEMALMTLEEKVKQSRMDAMDATKTRA